MEVTVEMIVEYATLCARTSLNRYPITSTVQRNVYDQFAMRSVRHSLASPYVLEPAPAAGFSTEVTSKVV